MKIVFLLPIAVCAVGTYLLFKLRFFFILHPVITVRELTAQLKDRASRRAFFLALAGTLGVGNIFGVAAGIMIGGAGSVFWLFISSLFAMVIKYAEAASVFDTSDKSKGMSGVIYSTFSRSGRWLSLIYAALTVALALFMGSAIQTEAFCDVAKASFSLDPLFSGLILSIFFLPCLFGGVRKIESITEILIPMTTIIYIIMCFAVIFDNITSLPSVVYQIINSAFSPSAAIGGGLALVIKEGFARGILSNEAGTGTSALAHSRSNASSPHSAGLFGMAEVFFDTTALCTLTALTVLLSVNNIEFFDSPMSLVCAAFSNTFGVFGGYALTLLIFCFAYSTVICWYFYGHRYMSIYFQPLLPLYTFSFLLFFTVSSLLPSNRLLQITDLILLLMSVITLSVIVKKADRIKNLCKTKKGNGI